MNVIELKPGADGRGHFVWGERPVPALREHQDVLVRVTAVSFNPIDAQMRAGMSEVKLATSSIIGRECAGVVEAVHPSSKTQLKPGDRVCAYVGNLASSGTHARFVAIPSEVLVRVPSDISDEVATCIPLSATAVQALGRVVIKDDALVFVAGAAGGVGTYLVQLLQQTHAGRVVATYGSDQSCKHLLSLGLSADHLVDYRAQDAVAALMEKSGGRGFDICFDAVGNHMSEVCAEVLRPFGDYVDITCFSTDGARELLFDKAARITCVANYAYAYWHHHPSFRTALTPYREMIQDLARRISDGSIRPPHVEVLGPFAPETVEQACNLLEANSARGRKFVMRLSS